MPTKMFASQHMARTVHVAMSARCGRGVAWSTMAWETTGRGGPSITRCAAHGQRSFASSARYWAKGKQEEKQTLSQLLDTRKRAGFGRRIGLVGAGLAAAVLGAYVVMLVLSVAKSDPEPGDCCAEPTGRPLDLRQGKISALMFDKDLNRPESVMGVKGLRQLMGGLARGHVLEVAVGTGRNVEYVDWEEIKATAPPVARVAEDGTEVTAEVKSEAQLERERVTRRLAKGKRGMVLPGDESPEVLSYTGADVSTEVLEVAWNKLRKAVPDLIPRRRRNTQEETQPEQQRQQQQQQQRTETSTAIATPHPPSPTQTADEALVANLGQGRIRLYKSDAQSHLPPPPAVLSHDSSRVVPAPRYYDTVLQNFGLCSVADPQALLANMAAATRPGSGRIYLVEHGRGSYGWLNGLLDRFAPRHFQRYGCWWNRDIEDIVRKAETAVPGLEVVRIERPLWLQGGTMLWIEMRVNPERAKDKDRSRGS